MVNNLFETGGILMIYKQKQQLFPSGPAVIPSGWSVFPSGALLKPNNTHWGIINKREKGLLKKAPFHLT